MRPAQDKSLLASPVAALVVALVAALAAPGCTPKDRHWLGVGADPDQGSSGSPAAADPHELATATGSDDATSAMTSTSVVDGPGTGTGTGDGPTLPEDALLPETGGVATAKGIIVELPKDAVKAPVLLKVRRLAEPYPGSDRLGDEQIVLLGYEITVVDAATSVALSSSALLKPLAVTATLPDDLAFDTASVGVLELGKEEDGNATGKPLTPVAHPDGSAFVKHTLAAPSATVLIVADRRYIEIPLNLERPAFVGAPGTLTFDTGAAISGVQLEAADPDPLGAVQYELSDEGTCGPTELASSFSPPLSLDPVTGSLSGTPTADGLSCFLVVAATSQGDTTTATILLQTVTPLAALCDTGSLSGTCVVSRSKVIRPGQTLAVGAIGAGGALVVQAPATLATAGEGALTIGSEGDVVIEPGAAVAAGPLAITAAGTVTIDGSLRSRGTDGVEPSPDGASGANVSVTADIFAGAATGVIDAAGGDGFAGAALGSRGDGGNGGHVVVSYKSSDTFAGSISVAGGAATAPATPGTAGSVSRTVAP